MAVKLVKRYPENTTLKWTNGTGEAVVSDEIVDAGLESMAVALQDIANGAEGMIAVRGQYEGLASSAAIAAGAIVYQDTNDGGLLKAWTPGTTIKPLGRNESAKGSGEATIRVNIGDVNPRVFALRRVATAGEDSANAAVIPHGLGATPTYFQVLIASTGNVTRVPQGAVTADATAITVADSGLAVNETLIVLAFLA